MMSTLQRKTKKKKNELGLIPLILFAYLGLSFLIIWISYIKIFSKAAQSWWKALIPFFNLFIFTKIVEKPLWFFVLYLVLPIGYFLSAFQIAKSFGKNIIFSIGLIFLPIVFFPLLAFGKSEYKKEK